MVPQKRPVISRFQFRGFWGKMQSAYYTPQTPGISSNKDFQNHGPPKKTCDKQISISGVLGQDAICLLHPTNPRNFFK